MALFFADDGYSMQSRQTGFARYRQLLSFYAMHWMLVNLITLLGALPLAAGIGFALLSSSVVVLLPASFVGGMIFGPFLAALYDTLLRGLRDAPGNRWANYRKAWRQNWKAALLPGGITGLLLGVYAFMIYLLWVAQTATGAGTLVLYAVGCVLLFLVSSLYWPQLVLFRQSAANRMANIILFASKYFWRVLGICLLQAGYWLLHLLLAPWSLLLLPVLGLWYILFLSQFLIYDQLNEALRIEEQFYALEGDPWAEDEWEADAEDASRSVWNDLQG